MRRLPVTVLVACCVQAASAVEPPRHSPPATQPAPTTLEEIKAKQLNIFMRMAKSQLSHASMRDELQQLHEQEVDVKLNDWIPDSDSIHPPHRSLRTSGLNIYGQWRGHRGMSGSTFMIDSAGNGKLKIDFKTSGCTDRWQLSRTGYYRDGVLTLNRPVREYDGPTYYKLYCVEFDRREYLVAAPLVKEFEKTIQLGDPKLLSSFLIIKCVFVRDGRIPKSGELR